MKSKVYIETSVISYLTSKPSKTIIGAAHQQITTAWWETRHQYDLYVSQSVIQECQAGDIEASRKRIAVIKDIPLLHITEESLEISEALLKNKIIPQNAAEDAVHIAIATAYEIDFLLTWNCKHIANPIIQKKIEDYLFGIGRCLPFICTPEELLGAENVE